MQNQARFEYVLSALQMIRMAVSAFYEGPGVPDAVNKYLREFNNDSSSPYKLSGLFNGFVEARMGQLLKQHYDKSFYNVHVDSGGLQVITLGKQITPELKQQIYTTQATYGSVAMCFDEIPLQVVSRSENNKNNRTSIDNKIFVTSDMLGSAAATGRNVNEQLRKFNDLGSECEVMLIAQGNNRQDFADWVHKAYDQVDDELKHQIHGIALADTCIGNGTLESVEMCAGYGLVDIDHIKKNIHFLGVGSLRRMIPAIELCRSGFFAKDVNISFDSTTHTSMLIMGRYTDENGRIQQIGKRLTPDNKKFFSGVYDLITSNFDTVVSKQDYIDHITTNLTNPQAIRGTDGYKELGELTYFFYCIKCVQNFMNAINECTKSQDAYFKFLTDMSRKQLKPMLQLANVKDSIDMDQWFKLYSRYVDSKRIERVVSSDQHHELTLSDFFNFSEAV